MTKGKRRQTVLVLIAAAAVLAGLWYVLVNSQYNRLAALRDKMNAAEHETDKVRKALAGAAELEAKLIAAADRLDNDEAGMATGDLYSWVVNSLRQFKLAHKDVDVPQFGQPLEKATTLLPDFPYRQVSVNILGTAYYHDLGAFIAEFENQHPYSRIQNLELEPAAAASGAEREKLTFRMDIVTLVKPTS